jgi:hypothetical protein
MKYVCVFEASEIPLIDPIIYLFILIVLFCFSISLYILINNKRPLSPEAKNIATGGLMVTILLSTIVFFILRFSIPDRLELKKKYSTKIYEVAEGYVTNFHPMPIEGHQHESFLLDGQYFEYSDYETSFGFNNTASHGGPIRKNGQYLRISYVKSGKDNIILKIEIRQ